MVPPDIWSHFAKQFGHREDDRAFNAGVLALRPEDWRDLPEKYERALDEGKYPYYPRGFDQALLNGLFLPHVNWLPRSFNWHALFEQGLPRSARVIHYTDSPKPWMPGFRCHWIGYYEWIRYGMGCTDRFQLAYLRAAKTGNVAWRFGYKAVRKVMTKLGLREHHFGVGR
jgi:lipopolysaccharide biosynthesis glycosyltransferase